MKVSLKLFAGLFVMGSVVAIVSTVLTSCKSEAKQEDPLSFTFSKSHNDTNKLKSFLDDPAHKIEPSVEGIDNGNSENWALDATNKKLYSTNKTRGLLFNENLPKLYIKSFLSSLQSEISQYQFSDTPQSGSGIKSTTLKVNFSQNNATLITTTIGWNDSQLYTTTLITKANYLTNNFKTTMQAWADVNGTLVESMNDVTERSTLENWYIRKDTNSTYHIHFADDDDFSICNNDWTSIKRIYEGMILN